MGVEAPQTDIGKVMNCAATPNEALPPAAAAINATFKQAGAGCP